MELEPERRLLTLALSRVHREVERLGDEAIGVANATLHAVTSAAWDACPGASAPWPLGDLAGYQAEIAALDGLRKRLGVRRRNGGCTW